MDVAERIVRAFPSHIAGEAQALAAAVADDGATLSPDSFSVIVDGETVAIPERLYGADHRARRGAGGPDNCLLTRHHDGFVRQRMLGRVLLLKEAWATPFIVRLVGEYVVEIIAQIDEAFADLPAAPMAAFVSANPAFIRLIRARVTSYWDCYYRATPRGEYVGFRLMERIEAAAAR